MSEPTKETMSIEQLRLEPCFIRLTERQKLMIETYVASGGDRVAAVLAAYNVKDRETARKMSYESFSRPAVIQVLNAYWGLTPFQAFKRDVERAVRNKRLTTAQVSALILQARINGWGYANLPNLHGHDKSEAAESEPEDESPKFHVGDMATLDGKHYRVTAVNPNGTVSEADPL